MPLTNPIDYAYPPYAPSSSMPGDPSPTHFHYSDGSEEEALNEAPDSSRKRSSRACDQCRKTKSKCERGVDDHAPCKSCAVAGLECTFLGPSYKRGPPKGYIHAIEQRWHHVESVLGAILASPDPRAQGIIADLKGDDIAREIISRVDNGPFGPSGRIHQPASSAKEDVFASIMNSHSAGQNREGGRSRRQSRVSREIVSSSGDRSHLPSPTNEWQDRLSQRLAASYRSRESYDSYNGHGQNASRQHAQRRRLGSSGQPDWNNLYTMDGETDPEDEMSEVIEEGAEAIGHLSLDENRELRYHGSSSGLALLNRAARKDQRNEGGIWRIPMAGVWPHSTIRPARLHNEENLDIRMPPMNEQDMLVETYFTHIHPSFPIVNKHKFMQEYNEKFHGSPAEDSSSRGNSPPSGQASRLLVLVMCALGSRYVRQPEELSDSNAMWEAGCSYSLDAREVLNKVYHHSRPSTCQALLLLGLYECAVGSMEHSWLYIGMAVRMAADLGLNRNSDKWSYNGYELFTATEKQIRKQIWWGCCMIEKYISVVMGRPIAVNRIDFDTPMPDIISHEDEELWRPLRQDPQYNPSYQPAPERAIACFRASCALALIVGDIMKKIYPVRSMPKYSRKQELHSLGMRLDRWYIDLPEELRYDTHSKRATPPPNVLLLHVRYWSTVLLLHRPFIPKRIGSSLESDTVLLKAFDMCQSAASRTSAIAAAWDAEHGLKCGSPLLPPYLLNAGIMHIVTLTLRPSNIQASMGLQQSLACLKQMEVIWPMAHRAWELLNGAKVQYEGAVSPFIGSPERNKRGADEAFSHERTSEMLQRDAFPQKAPSPAATGGQDDGTRMMAHMLGLELPGIEPSTSYFPGYEWWPRMNQANVAAHGSAPSSASSEYDMGSSAPPPAAMGGGSEWLQTMMNPYSFDPGQHSTGV